MKVWYTVQRTRPDPLTGSEVYIHDLEEGMSQFCETLILATHDPLTGAKASLIESDPNVRLFNQSQSWLAARLLYFIFSKDKSGSLLRRFSEIRDGFLYTMSQGFYSREMELFLRNGDFDIIHSAALTTPTLWMAWKSAISSKKPFIVTPFIHSAKSEFFYPYVSHLLCQASAIITMTEYEGRILEQFGVNRSRISAIPIGLDFSKYDDGYDHSFREKHGIPQDHFVVLLPRKAEEKGFFHSMDALLMLLHSCSEVTILMLDNTPPRLKKRVSKYKSDLTKNGGNVIDMGYITGNELVSAIRSSDVVVQPSRADSLGIVYLEAWACGKPVVASSVGAMNEVITDGEDGLLVEYANVREIFEAIKKILDKREFGVQLGSNGLDNAKKKYRVEDMVMRTRELYRSL